MKEHMNEASLALYLRGDLSGADHRAVAEHVQACTECQSTLEDLSRSHKLLVSSFEDPTPAELTAVRSAVAWRIRTQSRRPAWRIWAVTASAVVAVILVLANLPLQTQAPRPLVASTAPPVAIRIAPPAPPIIPAAHRRIVRRAPRMTLLTRAERPALLKINTSDPNIVILWQLNEKENEKAETP
jgi:anti-sigma factor RsiW